MQSRRRRTVHVPVKWLRLWTDSWLLPTFSPDLSGSYHCVLSWLGWIRQRWIVLPTQIQPFPSKDFLHNRKTCDSELLVVVGDWWLGVINVMEMVMDVCDSVHILDSEISLCNETSSAKLVPGGGPSIMVTILVLCSSVFGTRANGIIELLCMMTSPAASVAVTLCMWRGPGVSWRKEVGVRERVLWWEERREVFEPVLADPFLPVEFPFLWPISFVPPPHISHYRALSARTSTPCARQNGRRKRSHACSPARSPMSIVFPSFFSCISRLRGFVVNDIVCGILSSVLANLPPRKTSSQSIKFEIFPTTTDTSHVYLGFKINRNEHFWQIFV